MIAVGPDWTKNHSTGSLLKSWASILKCYRLKGTSNIGQFYDSSVWLDNVLCIIMLLFYWPPLRYLWWQIKSPSFATLPNCKIASTLNWTTHYKVLQAALTGVYFLLFLVVFVWKFWIACSSLVSLPMWKWCARNKVTVHSSSTRMVMFLQRGGLVFNRKLRRWLWFIFKRFFQVELSPDRLITSLSCV